MWTTLYFLFRQAFSVFVPPLVNGQIWTAVERGLTFIATARPLAWYSTMPTTLTKRSGETRLYAMDFSSQPELAGSGSIASVTSVVAEPLQSGQTNVSVTNPSIGSDTKQAVCWISGGVDGQYYRVTFTVTVAGGTTLEEFGFLMVDDNV